MKTAVGTFLTAGVATASAAAVALAPISPLNTASDEVVIVPAAVVQTQQRDVELASRWDDLSVAFDNLVTNIKDIPGDIQGGLEDYVAYLKTVDYPANKEAAIATLPHDGVIQGKKLIDRLRTPLDGALVITAYAVGGESGVAITTTSVAATRTLLEGTPMVIVNQSKANTRALLNTLKTNPKDVFKTLKGNSKAMREALGGEYDDIGTGLNKVGRGQLGAIRTAFDNQQGAVRSAVNNAVDKLVGSSTRHKLLDPVQKAADDVKTEVRKAVDSVRKTVRKALGDDKP